ncbi:Metallo-hydrolase/oxidoreductase [Cubamyces sp. BRFM 1775]|nr:Metallo-hydrolase/oxidoreductase [Cubamyces sp. BRFM 1775]
MGQKQTTQSSAPEPPSTEPNPNPNTKTETNPNTDTGAAVDVDTDNSPRGHRAFTARRLASTTFLITEVDDIYDERPFIYAKLVPAARTVLLLDTGCGGATHAPEASFRRLRDFLEYAPVTDNGALPLNAGGAFGYVVVLSHCHYDHILGVEQFAGDSPVIQSGYDPAFLAADKLPEHSLCAFLGIPTPSYKPSLQPDQSPLLSKDNISLGMTLLHTPGHTPDELALWDADEGMLYVGDTLYEWAHIIFPKEGSIVLWLESVDKLARLVAESGNSDAVKINCGHMTAKGSAMDVLRSTKAFMLDVVEGRENVKSRMHKRGEEYVEYAQDGGRYSLICPERLVQEARRAMSCDARTA